MSLIYTPFVFCGVFINFLTKRFLYIVYRYSTNHLTRKHVKAKRDRQMHSSACAPLISVIFVHCQDSWVSILATSKNLTHYPCYLAGLLQSNLVANAEHRFLMMQPIRSVKAFPINYLSQHMRSFE